MSLRSLALPARTSRRLAVPALLLLGLAILGGCQLPNIAPFAEGVAAVHVGVDESGVIFREGAAIVLPPGDPGLATLEEHWRKRRDATAALSEYADSLASIVDSGKKGAQAAHEAGAAVGALMEQVGATGLAGSAALQIGGEIYGVVAQGLAAQALDRAIANGGPAVARTCEILVLDLRSIRAALDAIEQDALAEAETDAYLDEKGTFLPDLLARRQALLPSLDDGDAVATEVETLDRLITESRAVVEAGDARVAAVRRTFEAQRALLDRTIDAVQLVSREYAKLAAAVKSNRTISARTLIYSADQIGAAVARIETINRAEDSNRD